MKTNIPKEGATSPNPPAAPDTLRVRITAPDAKVKGKDIAQGRVLTLPADDAKMLIDLGLAEACELTPGDERPVLVRVLVNAAPINGFIKAIGHEETLPLHEAKFFQAQGLVKIVGL